MFRKFLNIILPLMCMGASAHGANKLMDDPGVKAACQQVWDACQHANVTDPKTGKPGYQFGEAKDGTGLWAQCVAPLAKGRGRGYPVPGLNNPPSQDAAKGCMAAMKTFCSANPNVCHH